MGNFINRLQKEFLIQCLKWAENDKIDQKFVKNGLILTKTRRVREFKVREFMYRANYMVREL